MLLRYKYAILGGGVVAGYAARAFAEHDLKPHDVCLISADNALPYDRPSLSKAFLRGETNPADMLINDTKFYRVNGIDHLLNTRAESVDIEQRRIDTHLNTSIRFEKLIIATGARTRRFDLPNADLEGIYYLRQLDDAQKILAATENATEVIVVGGGFIGMEVSASLASLGLHVTMIFPEERLMQHFFTPQMSDFFQDYYRERGVTTLPKVKPVAFAGRERVSSVALDTGQEIPVDMVIGGIGAEPRTELFANSPLQIDDGIMVNKYLETNMTGIYAAGDVANYYDTLFEKWRRLEHWDNAVQQSQHVVQDMMRKNRQREIFIYIPYYFSDVFDLSYEFWGDTEGADTIVHRGNVSSGSFSVWWLENAQLVAGLTMNRHDEEREIIPEWIQNRPLLQTEVLADESKPLWKSNSLYIASPT